MNPLPPGERVGVKGEGSTEPAAAQPDQPARRQNAVPGIGEGQEIVLHQPDQMRRHCDQRDGQREHGDCGLGRLHEPLLAPNENEREGYVPNVVYTCGALLHNGELIIPYGMADHATGFATVPLDEVLAAMQ